VTVAVYDSRPLKVPTRPERETRLFAWQGMEARVPSDWELGAFRGDFSEGQAYLDDGTDTRMRLRWSSRRTRSIRLEKTLRKYQRRMLKGRPSGAQFEMLDLSFFPKPFRENRDVAAFHWVLGQTAYGAAWRCRECGRFVIAEILFPAGQDSRKTAKAVLNTITDHRSDGQRLWSVYGFAFRVPQSYNLISPKLQSGRLHFTFEQAKSSWLIIERWGMASQMLARLAFERWPLELLKVLKVGSVSGFQQERDPVGPDEGCRFSGDLRTRLIGKLLKRPSQLRGRIWHDRENDKIVAVIQAGGSDEVLDRVVASVDSI
jgi:hypothetical protein